MKISLIKNGKIYNTNLPTKINGSFWIEDKNKNNFKRNLINIESKDGKWCLKSNFEAKISYGGEFYDEVILEDYSIFELQVKGEKYNYILCTSPVYDTNSIEVTVNDNNQIYIGNSPDNTINYSNIYVAQKQCLLSVVNGIWQLKNLSNNGVVFVNGIVTNEKVLSIGDVVFIMNLKIIICGNYIIINRPKGLIGYSDKILKIKEPLNIQKNKNTNEIEEDTEVNVYDKNEYFFRMPRFRVSVEKEEINIDPPPEEEKQDEMPLAYTLGPMITMGITSMVSGITSLNNLMSGQQTLSSALPSLITCVAMLFSMMGWPLLQKRYSKSQLKKRQRLRIKKYNNYIDERRQYIKNVIAKQRQSLIENNIPLEECAQIIRNRKRNLWERKIEHNDFLNLRLGTGNLEPYIKINYPEEHFSLTENNLRETLDKLVQENRTMTDVPVAVNLTEKFISAIVAKSNLIKPFVEGLLLQIMTFHSYEDLKIIVMTSKENEKKWEYLKSSPYLSDDQKTIRFFSTDLDEANQISIYLDSYFQKRKYEDGDTAKVKEQNYKNYKPYFLIITDDYQSIRNIEIIKNVLSQTINYGFSMLIVQERLLGLPNECSMFVNVDVSDSGVFENELTKDKQKSFKADFIGNINIEEINNLVANIPIEISENKFSLPEKVGFLEMYNVGKIDQLNPLNRWKNNNPITSLSVPVGIDTNGELFKLDLHEKFHGPHGLIAGMTGSGKSEFIITYILSMAVNFHPDEVSFVLIDYKGGGLAGAFENKETGVHIPHLSGTITNLDINDMKRSLASIESELKTRQRLFNEAREKLNESTIDIYKYQRLKREGKVTEPIPHLFIISDEFAELKTQQPEFMEQLISTARIGRSLGVHLILATQKPSGIVDDQIWSNTKFRVCLKVQDKSDSNDMIKCPDAAALKNVGSFYLQVGYNEFFALGQSAYAGVPYFDTDKIKRKVDTNINFINNVGYSIKTVDREEDVVNKKSHGEELSNIVNYLYNLGKQENVFAKQLWLDKIPEDIYVDELENKYNYVSQKCFINPVIGEYDDPSTQSKHLLTLPLSTGNAIIYGSTGVGKEDLLGTVIYSTVLKHTPAEITIYVIDCGSETLKIYDSIPHIGDVLLSNDSESIKNLFKMLKEEIDRRKKLFANYGGSYEYYVKNSGNVIPNIMVIINLYEAFEEIYQDLEDDLNLLTREGLKYGIIFILTTSGSNFIRYKLKQNFNQNLVLQLNNENDYFDVVGNTHGLFPSKIKGRGLIKFKDIYEFQSAKFKNNGDSMEYIKVLSSKLNEIYPNKAKGIPVLPKIVNFDVVKDEIKGINNVPIGIEKSSLKVSTVNLLERPLNMFLSTDLSVFEKFVPEFVKVCSFIKDWPIIIIDAEKIFESEKFNCNYYKDDIDKVFNNIHIYLEKLNINNNQQQVINNNLLIIIIGINKFKNKLSPETQDKLNQFMDMVKASIKARIVIFDTIENIKELEYNDWFKSTFDNNHAVWIGEGLSSQYTIKVSNNSRTMREDIDEKFGYNIKKSKPILVKLLSNATEEEEEIEEYV